MTGLQSIKRSKFSMDLFWNAVSFGFIALIGVIINVIIINMNGSASLGIFNQVYAIYILLSQLAVGGVHLSVQRYIPKHSSVPAHPKQILSAAVLITGLISVLVVALGYALKDIPGMILQSPDVSYAYQLALWGLIFFSFNKVLLSYYNGMRNMKGFAFFQLLRFVLMLACLAVIEIRKYPPVNISLILPVSELILFLVLFFLNYRHLSFHPGWRMKRWLKIHFRFGKQALIGNFLLDINTRVDVFILGIFLSDKMVGIYSFASTIAEGFLQLPVLFRNNINPVITKASMKSKAVLQKIITRNIRSFYKTLSPLALLSILCFPLVTWIFGVKEEPVAMWIVYSILVGSVVLTSGYLPFLMIFNQLGKPMLQTRYIFMIFIVNVVFNLLLVPFFGIYGSAIGTAIATVAQMVLMKTLVSKNLSLKL